MGGGVAAYEGKASQSKEAGNAGLCGPGGGVHDRNQFPGDPGLSDSPMQGSSFPPRSLPQLLMKFIFL